jgi:hypothetical protein
MSRVTTSDPKAQLQGVTSRTRMTTPRHFMPLMRSNDRAGHVPRLSDYCVVSQGSDE